MPSKKSDLLLQIYAATLPEKRDEKFEAKFQAAYIMAMVEEENRPDLLAYAEQLAFNNRGYE